MPRALLAALVTVIALGAAPAAAIERVAVLEFVANPTKAASDVALASLTDEVRRAAVDVLPNARFSVMTKENQETVLRENGVDAKAMCDAECEVDLARTIGAALLVTGSVNKIGSRLSMHIKIFHAQRGQVLKIVKVSGKDEGELYDLVYDQAVRLFREGLGIAAPVAAAPVAAAPVAAAPVAAAPLAAPPSSAPSVGTVRMSFRSAPSGARVLVDNVLFCPSTPCDVSVPRRPGVARFEHDDFLPVEEALSPVEGLVLEKTLEANFAELVFPDFDDLEGVWLDGNPVELARESLRVAPGRHTVRLADEACHEGGEREFDLALGERKKVTGILKPRMAQAKIEGQIEGKRFVGATVAIDDEEPVPLPLDAMTVPLCADKVTITHPRGISKSRALELVEGETTEVVVPFEADDFRESSTAILVWNGANLALSILTLVGGYFGAVATIGVVIYGGLFGLLLASSGGYQYAAGIAGVAAVAGAGTVAALALGVTGVVWSIASMVNGNFPGSPSVGPLCIPCWPAGAWLWIDDDDDALPEQALGE